MSNEWRFALGRVAQLLNGAHLQWMLLGSAATALRGALIEPGDIDIAPATPADVRAAADVLPTPSGRSPAGSETWYSSVEEPVLTFGDKERWTFGRWTVDGVKVELGHIADPSVGDLFLETASTSVWNELSFIDVNGVPVPVVPVEAQVATMIARGQSERLQATISALEPASIDVGLLRRALADRQTRDRTSLHLPEAIRTILGRA